MGSVLSPYHQTVPLMKRLLLLCFLASSASLFSNALYAQASSPLSEGIMHLDEGRLAEAQAFFTSYLETHPSDANATFYLGRSYFEEDPKEAGTWFARAIDLNATVSDYHSWMGNALGRQAQSAGKLKQARLARRAKKSWDKAVELDPANLDARQSLIQFYLQAPGFMGGSTKKAQEQADAILEYNVRRGHSAWGDVHWHEKAYDEAAQAYRAALDAEPSFRGSYYQLARFYRSRQQFDKGIAVFYELLALDSTQANVYYQIGTYHQQAEAYGDALEAFETMLELDSDSWYARYQIGRTAALSGQFLDQGQASLEAYLQHTPEGNQPSLAWAHFRLGQIHAHQNDLAQARRSYEAALALDSDHEEAQKALKTL